MNHLLDAYDKALNNLQAASPARITYDVFLAAFTKAREELLAALSPPAAEGKDETGRALFNLIQERFGVFGRYEDQAQDWIDAATAFRALPHPAPAAEPVACRWRYDYGDGKFSNWTHRGGLREAEAAAGHWAAIAVEPLYTSPPPEPVAISREDIETLCSRLSYICNAYDLGDDTFLFEKALQQLKDALSKLSGYPLVEGGER